MAANVGTFVVGLHVSHAASGGAIGGSRTSSHAGRCRKQGEINDSSCRTMARILYAGYLAFALYLLYPMIHNTLNFSMDCMLNALPGGDRDMPQRTASGASTQGSRCAADTQLVARSPGIH
ncbi:hypothetical protein [Burkholderia anthina]|uniref:hypothetical protein n=1 Tax=Burkholderia anthina TaxID=179879 RepID=UPI003C7CC449